MDSKELYELYHHGILGMKWGVHRRRNKNGTITKNAKNKVEYHDDYKNAHTKKKMKMMSNDELQKRIKRLNMEKQYKQLTGEKTSKGAQFVKKGAAVVQKIVSDAAKQTASKYVSKYMSKRVDSLFDRLSKE